MDKNVLSRLELADDVREMLESVPTLTIPNSREQMLEMTFQEIGRASCRERVSFTV